MYFCPKCNYLFDISKSSNMTEDNRIIIKKAVDVFKKLESKEDLTNYKAEFKQEELTKNSKYKKLSEEERKILESIFEESSISGAEFRCKNCNFVEKINETVLLYQYETQTNNINIKTLEENELICSNPTLPRTHDYICKNVSCSTNKINSDTNKKETNKKNKKEESNKKEAVFYRDNNTFKVNYICCVCYYSW